MRHFTFLFLLFCFFSSLAQIGVNTVSPDTTSILDISSRQKGLLIPRMSSSERQAIQNKSNSLLVYDTDSAKYMFALNNLWYVLNPINAPAANTDSVTLRKKLSLGNPQNPVGNKLTVHGDETVKGTLYANQVNTSSLQTNGNAQINGNLTLQGTLNATQLNVPGFGLVPKGVIVMWSGAIDQIPTDWALCDGSNGAPDLRGRFVVGSGQNQAPDTRESINPNYVVGGIGGVNSYALTINEIPSHDHGGGNHSHKESIGYGDPGSDGDTKEPQMNQSGNTEYTQPSGNVIFPQGEGQSHENRPPFYVLAYIIKL